MKYSTKLSILLFTLVVLAGTIITTFVYFSNLKTLDTQIKTRLENHAIQLMDKISRNLYERYSDIKLIATDPIITSMESTPKQITQRLIEYRNVYKTYASLSFFDLSRKRISDTAGLDLGITHPITKYWKKVLKGEISAASNISHSEGLKIPCIYFTSPVKNKKGKIFGVVTARMPISIIHFLTSNTSYKHKKENGVLGIDLINKNGLILYSSHNRKGILKDSISNWELFKKAKSLKAGESRIIYSSFQDKENIFVVVKEHGYLDFRGNGWFLLVHIPTATAFAPAIALRNKTIIIIAITFLFILIIIIISVRKFTKPIRELASFVRKIGDGNLDTKINIKSKDEIGELGVSFNQMVDNLAQANNDLTQLSKFPLENPNPVLRISDEKIILNANEAAVDILIDEDIAPGNNFNLWNDVIDKAIASSSINKIEETHKNNSTFSWIFVPLKGTNYLNIYATDITERKKIEEELRLHQKELEIQNDELRKAHMDLSDARNQYADLYDFAPVGYIVLDTKFNIADTNITICKMLGVSRLFLYKQGFFSFLSEDDRDTFSLLCHKVFTSNSEQNFETTLLKKDGNEFYVSLECVPKENSDGVVSRIRIAIIDISKRKEMELNLQALELKYRSLIQGVPDVLYSALPDKNGTILFISDKWKDWTGCSPEECYNDPHVWPNSIHPDDKENAVNLFVDAISNKKENHSEYRLLNKDNGHMRWVFDHGLPIFDEKGNVIRYDGSVTDITYRKEMELSIIAEKEFSNNVMQSIPGLFYVFEKESSKFLKRNNNWKTITGYSNEELDSMTALDFLVDRDLCAKRMQEAFDHGTSSMEGLLLTKSGEQIAYFFTGQRMEIDGKLFLAGVGIDISKRKNMEEIIKNKEQNLRVLLESLGDAVLATDLYSNITQMNPMAEKLTGWTFDTAKGLPLAEVFKIFNSKTRQPVINPVDTVISQGKATGLANHTVLISKDGSEYQISDSASPIINDEEEIIGAVLVFSDITEQYHIKEALESRLIALTHPVDDVSSILFENLFNIKEIQIIQDQFAEATGVASIITTPDGVPITNPSNFCRLCRDIIRPTKIGCKNCQESDKILGQPNSFGPIVQPCMSGGLWDAGASIMVGGKHIATWLIGQVRNKTQREEKVLLYADVIGADKEDFLKAYREVTIMSEKQFNKVAQTLYTLAKQLSTIAYQNVQQARFIEDRMSAIETLETKTTELVNSNRYLEQFAYAASHDLQEPLRVISSSLKIIENEQKSVMTEKSLKFFAFAAEGAMRMKQLINALLEASRIRSEKVFFKTIDLNKTMNEVLFELKDVISNSKANISYNSLPRVTGNEELLITLFKNIISNGIKYNKNSKPIIKISWKEWDDKIELCIGDNGIGIEEKNYDRIFVMFKRLHPRTQYPGTGMGLAVCKNIIEIHGGKIWTESEKEEGSKIYFTLKKASTLDS